jgi:hypothetical protein
VPLRVSSVHLTRGLRLRKIQNPLTEAGRAAGSLSTGTKEPNSPIGRYNGGHGMRFCPKDQKPQLQAPQPLAGAFLFGSYSFQTKV